MAFVFTLFVAILSFAETPCTDQFTLIQKRERASPTWYKQKDFMQVSKYITQNEPELLIDPRFREMQQWTLKYQKFANLSDKDKAGPFIQLFSVGSHDIDLKPLAAAYEQYAKVSMELTEELPVHLKMHVKMFEGDKEKQDYMRRFHESVDSLFKNYTGDKKKVKIFFCDYTSQPLDTLWFTSHAVQLLDEYGMAIFGCKWTAERAKIQSRVKVQSPEEVGETMHKAFDGVANNVAADAAIAKPAAAKPATAKPAQTKEPGMK
jgi:hypothetical protein